jgi:hypothetical protein
MNNASSSFVYILCIPSMFCEEIHFGPMLLSVPPVMEELFALCMYVYGHHN